MQYPTAYLKLSDVDALRPSPADPFHAGIHARPRDMLKRRLSALRDETKEILERLADPADENDQQPAVDATIETRIY